MTGSTAWAAGRFEDGWARVISGADEGVFGWIALNYLAGRLMTARPALLVPGASSESAPNSTAPSGSAAARVASAVGATSAEGIFSPGEGLHAPRGRCTGASVRPVCARPANPLVDHFPADPCHKGKISASAAWKGSHVAALAYCKLHSMYQKAAMVDWAS